MADVFDAEVDPRWRADLWEVVRQTTFLDWLILTKRPENIAGMLPPDWVDGWHHVCLMTSVEDQKELHVFPSCSISQRDSGVFRWNL